VGAVFCGYSDERGGTPRDCAVVGAFCDEDFAFLGLGAGDLGFGKAWISAKDEGKWEIDD
jgi:hypothetical protein